MSREEKIAQAWFACLRYRNGNVEQAAAMMSAAIDLAAIWQRQGKAAAR